MCVSDLARALAFCRDVLGLLEVPRLELGIPGAWLGAGGGLKLHLIENPPGSRRARTGPCRSRIRTSLWTDDVSAMVEALRRKGFEVLENKHRSLPLRQAYLKDPDGNMVAFIGPVQRSAAG